jgi:DNA-binding NarL/FixJ family response regulator
VSAAGDRAPRCPVVVGRASIIERVHGLIDALDRSGVSVALLAGEAGIGKSRVALEAKLYAAARGFTVIEGACFPRDRSCPYALLMDLLKPRSVDELHPPMLERLAPYARDLRPLLPDLVAATDVSMPRPEPDSELTRRRLFDALAQIVIDEASARPVLVLVEDLHWCDETSLDVLLHLVHRAGRRPLLLLGTYRNDELEPALRRWLAELDRERLAQEYALSPLNRGEVATMLHAMIGATETVSPDVVDAIDTLAEGNPFFVEELANSLPRSTDRRMEAGVPPIPVQRENSWQIPRSLHASVAQRVDRLSDEARDVLRVAAVVGRRFDFDLLARVAGADETRLLALIKELVGASLVVEESPHVFTFRHALIQQAVYGDLLGRERITLHRLIAEQTEEIDEGAAEHHLPDLAFHYARGEVWDKALVYARRAGEQALRVYAPGPAVEHFTRALEAAERLARSSMDDGAELVASLRPGLYRGRARAFETLGDFDRALVDYETAVDLSREAEDPRAEWQSLLDLGMLWSARDYLRAGPFFQSALERARALGDPDLLARSLNRVGNWRANTSEPWQSVPMHEEALSLFEQLGDRDGTAETLDLLGMARFLSAEISTGLHYFERAAALFRRHNDRRGLSSALAMLASRCGFHDLDCFAAGAECVDQALRDGEEALQIARSIHWRAGEAFALFQIGLLLGQRGEFDRALAMASDSLRVAEQIDHPQWTAAAHFTLASLHVELLDGDAARRHAERALVFGRRLGSSFWIQLGTSLLACAHILRRDLDGADAVLSTLPALDQAAPVRSLGGWWRTFASIQLALARGDPALALRLDEFLTRPPVEGDPPRDTPRLALARGQAQIALNRLAEAESTLTMAREAARRQNARPLLWRVHVAVGTLYRARSMQDEARQEFALARSLIEDLAAQIHEPALHGGFLQNATAMLPRAFRLSPQRTLAARFGGLTAREREVAVLIGRGQSNREIAATLVLGERTIETHVSNILAKLGAGSRREIAAWIVAQGAMTEP